MIINIIHLSSIQVADTYPNYIKAEEFRRQHYLEQMCQQRAKFTVWDGVIAQPNFTGISRAHRAIVQHAKNMKLPQVLIMEDDCQFTSPNSLKYFLEHIPEDFDIYTGLLYYGQMDENNRITNGGSGIMTCYIVSARFYDVFLSADESNHIDRWLGDMAFKYKYIVCNPMICEQVGGYSYNHRKIQYYDQYKRDKVFLTD